MRKLIHLSLLVLFLSVSSSALGQSNYASLSGTVFDPQQKAIPGAAVQLISDSTQASRSVNSNEQGIYQFTALLPGTYKLTVQASGLASLTQSVTLEVGQQMTLDISLKLSSLSTTVDVRLTLPTCCELLMRAWEKLSSLHQFATFHSTVEC